MARARRPLRMPDSVVLRHEMKVGWGRSFDKDNVDPVVARAAVCYRKPGRTIRIDAVPSVDAIGQGMERWAVHTGSGQ